MEMHRARRPGGRDPFDSLTGFRLNKTEKAVAWIEDDGAPAIARLFRRGDDIEVEIDAGAAAAGRRTGEALPPARRFSFTAAPYADGWRIGSNGVTVAAFVAPHGGGARVFIGADYWDIALPDPLAGAQVSHSAGGSLVAPMPGVVTLIRARPGESVEAGAVLMIMEAMKMEHAVKAPHDGVVKAFRFKAGDQVKDGDLLVEFEESA